MLGNWKVVDGFGNILYSGISEAEAKREAEHRNHGLTTNPYTAAPKDAHVPNQIFNIRPLKW